jgi:hypothetical protein
MQLFLEQVPPVHLDHTTPRACRKKRSARTAATAVAAFALKNLDPLPPRTHTRTRCCAT